jgi:DNA-binding MarR family transcriptional regulator
METLEKTSEELLQAAIDRFWETVPPVWNKVRGNVRCNATENFEITLDQFHILRHIRKGRGSVSELADLQQISRPAISQAVDILVEKGLISRRTNADDRRYIRLELTPSGNDLLNAIFGQNRNWMMEKMAGLSPDEIISIVHGLEILKQTFIEKK